MNVMTLFALSLLGLFLLPVLVSGCLPYGRDGVPWYEARRDPTRLAPDPATTPEAVIQVYAARAVSWRGVFSMHTWIAVKPSGAGRHAMRATRCSALALPKARFGSGAVSGSVDAGMGLHREADPNVGAAFNIATHSQPVVLTPQTAHFGRQVQLPLA
jgi:hypothetical protein